MTPAGCLGLWLAFLSGAPDIPPHARPELLVEVAALQKAAPARAVTVLDARGSKAYAEGHVPGALVVDASSWAKAFASEKPLTHWQKVIGGLGLTASTPVVVYDAGGSTEAARVWWILRYWGVKDVRLLNGGWKAWTASGGKVEKEARPPTPVKANLRGHPERLATKGQLLAALKAKTPGEILDVRSDAEHCGEKALAARGGTIPGAKHLEWKATLDPKTGKFKSPTELTALFRKAGIDPKKPATTFCQSGGRAAVMAFVLELMGGEARNYYRSWSEWGNDPDTPIARPKKK